MKKFQNLIYLIIIGMLLASACTVQAPATSLPNNPGAVSDAKAPQSASTSTPEPLQPLDPAVQAAMKECAKIVAGRVCLVEGPVQVTAQPERFLRPFNKPGQTLILADIQSLKLGETGSTKGMVMMRIPTEWPGGSFAVVAFGDVELVNEVPYGTREFNPMQSLTLTTGPNEEGKAPTSGFLVASPQDGNLSTLVVNGEELSFGSGAVLTGQQGGLSIRTMFGSVGAWIQDKIVEVVPGNLLDLSQQEIEQKVLDGDPAPDPASEAFMQAVDNLMADEGFWPRNNESRDEAFLQAVHEIDELTGISPADQASRDEAFLQAVHEMDELTGISPADQASRDEAFLRAVHEMDELTGISPKERERRFRALEELRKKQKPWKGGWWKETYGPVTETGQCDMEAAGDGGSGDGEPYTTEIPICRGNNGNTILFYESGTSYDRVASNLFAQSSVSAFDFLGNGKITTEGNFLTLQVVSPTRMILSNNSTDVDGCTRASVMYLDFVRDDPNVRCGRIIYVDPFDTPTPPPPTPEPQKVEPPVEGQYQARIGTITKACDPAAKAFAPSFTSASLSLSPEDKLVVDAVSTRYELEPSNLAYPYYVEGPEGERNRLGNFNLQAPVDATYGLMMSLTQMPNQQWSGSWLVMNEDATRLCGGSIDLLPPK